MASRVEDPTDEDKKKLHLLVKEAKFLNEQGLAKIKYPPVDTHPSPRKLR